jgi:hypothetical protein
MRTKLTKWQAGDITTGATEYTIICRQCERQQREHNHSKRKAEIQFRNDGWCLRQTKWHCEECAMKTGSAGDDCGSGGDVVGDVVNNAACCAVLVALAMVASIGLAVAMMMVAGFLIGIL